MSKITKKELRQRCIDNETAIARLESILKENGIERQPQLKQLDHSVFDGLDEKWRWAATDRNGKAFLFSRKPTASNIEWYAQSVFDYEKIGDNYDTSNWQNSLIERKELTGSDLCRAMLERGDKCVMIRMGARDDKQARDIGRFAIATSIDESGRFNVMSDQQPISKVDFAVPINNQGEPLTAAEAGL